MTPTTHVTRHAVIALPHIGAASVTVSPSDTGEGVHTRWHYPESTTTRADDQDIEDTFSDGFLSLSSSDVDEFSAGSAGNSATHGFPPSWDSLPPSSLPNTSFIIEMPTQKASPGGRSIFPTTPQPNLEKLLLQARAVGPDKGVESELDTIISNSPAQCSSPRPLQRSSPHLHIKTWVPTDPQATHLVFVPDEFTPEAIASRESTREALIERIQLAEETKMRTRHIEITRFVSVLSSADGNSSEFDTSDMDFDLDSDKVNRMDTCGGALDRSGSSLPFSLDLDNVLASRPGATNSPMGSKGKGSRDIEDNSLSRTLATIPNSDEGDAATIQAHLDSLSSRVRAKSFIRERTEPAEENEPHDDSQEQIDPAFPIAPENWGRATPPPDPEFQHTSLVNNTSVYPVTPPNAAAKPYGDSSFPYLYHDRGHRRSYLNLDPNLLRNPNFNPEPTPSPMGSPGSRPLARSLSEELEAVRGEAVRNTNSTVLRRQSDPVGPPGRKSNPRTNGSKSNARFAPYPPPKIVQPNPHYPSAGEAISSSSTQPQTRSHRGRRLGPCGTRIIELWDLE